MHQRCVYVLLGDEPSRMQLQIPAREHVACSLERQKSRDVFKPCKVCCSSRPKLPRKIRLPKKKATLMIAAPAIGNLHLCLTLYGVHTSGLAESEATAVVLGKFGPCLVQL